MVAGASNQSLEVSPPPGNSDAFGGINGSAISVVSESCLTSLAVVLNNHTVGSLPSALVTVSVYVRRAGNSTFDIIPSTTLTILTPVIDPVPFNTITARNTSLNVQMHDGDHLLIVFGSNTLTQWDTFAYQITLRQGSCD